MSKKTSDRFVKDMEQAGGEIRSRDEKPAPTIADSEVKLRHRYERLLLADGEYSFDVQRIGAHAIRGAIHDERNGAAKASDVAPEVIRHFVVAVKAGVFPDPDALLYVVERFQRHLADPGDLDRAFGLK